VKLKRFLIGGSAPLYTSNFLIQLFVRASTTFHLTKKMHFLVNIPFAFCRPLRQIDEEIRLLKTLRRFHKSRIFFSVLNDFFLYMIFQAQQKKYILLCLPTKPDKICVINYFLN